MQIKLSKERFFKILFVGGVPAMIAVSVLFPSLTAASAAALVCIVSLGSFLLDRRLKRQALMIASVALVAGGASIALPTVASVALLLAASIAGFASARRQGGAA